jgi:tRNA (cmo5U34)-methyltransferase
VSHFSDPDAVARYADGPPRMVPGLADMQRMARVLLAASAPRAARVLVLGAGGGLELKAFAAAEPEWTFDGVDPSAPMLALAAHTAAEHIARITLHQGYIDAAPEGPFDAAACLLTLHFMASAERGHALAQIRRRLRPGAPFVAAHISVDDDGAQRARWLARDEAFVVAAGVPPGEARRRREGLAGQLPMLSPQQDEALLRAAGFRDLDLFYAAGLFRGWVAYA